MQANKPLALAAALCGVLSQASAQDVFRFDSIPGISAEPHVQIDLGPALLGFAVAAARQSDPGAADMIAGLRGISVRVYEELADAPALLGFVNDTGRSLEQQGWERVVFVQDGTDNVRVHARVEDGQMVGMTFMVVDSSDAVFINIDGQIDPVQLGRVAASMGLGDMLGTFFGAAQSAMQGAPRPADPPSSAPQSSAPAPSAAPAATQP